jgi:phosphoglycolate phosphatase-like HAD superfamily hydrolase
MFQTVLFDVDGVLLSEERCFDTTALTVWELLYHPDFVGLEGEPVDPVPGDEEIRSIRQAVFHREEVLTWLKSCGMNSNWDMVSILFGYQLQRLLRQLHTHRPEWVKEMLQGEMNQTALQQIGEAVRSEGIRFQPDFGAVIYDFRDASMEKQAFLTHVNRLAEAWSGLSVTCFSHQTPMWELGQEVFQEWYLGSSLFEKEEGRPARSRKECFLQQEIPLASPEAIRKTLDQLLEKGIRLGIGTGRQALETEVPLDALGLYSAFDAKHVATASDVLKAEERFPERAPLGKPDPYTYVKAYLGRQTDDRVCLETPLPLPDKDQILIVGDSVADLLAARKIGCRFAATLTGPTGEKARAKFEELKADYILKDVTKLTEIIR